MKTLMEGWRKLLNEKTDPSSLIRGKTFREFVDYLENERGNAFVVFDTETTGLEAGAPEVQITELAAVAYDMDPWYKERGKPTEIRISNIPEEYSDFITPDGQFSVKIKLTEPVLKELARQKALMSISDRSDPLHVEYSKVEIPIIAKKMAWKELNKQFESDPSLKQRKISKKTGRPLKGLEPTRSGWNVWRKTRDQLLRTLTPQDVPLYRETHTNNPHEMGYKEEDKSGTVAALLSLGRYGSGTAPYKEFEQVFKAFATYLELIDESSQTRKIVVTAQNAPFDVKQMNTAYVSLTDEQGNAMEPPDYSVFDTAAAFREFLKPRVEIIKKKVKAGEHTTEREQKILNDLTAISRVSGREYITVSLGPLTKAFDVPDLGWHSAIADVKMTMETFLAVMNYIDKLDKEAEEGLPPSERTADDEARDLADRQGPPETQELTPDVAAAPVSIPGLDKLKEEWEYALTRKQRELIEREIAALKNKL